MNAPPSDRLAEYLWEFLELWKEDLECFREGGGTLARDFAKYRASAQREDPNEQQACLEVADGILGQTGQERAPWGTVTDRDIVEALETWTGSRDDLVPEKPPTPEEFSRDIRKALEDLQRPTKLLSFSIPVYSAQDHPFLTLERLFRKEEAHGILSVEGKWERQDKEGGNLYVGVRGVATPRAQEPFVQGIADVLWQATTIASMNESLAAPLGGFQPEHPQVGRIRGMSWDRESTSDGTPLGETDAGPEGENVFQIPIRIHVIDARRLAWVCTNALFDTPDQRDDTRKTKGESRKDTIRLGIWRMAECSRMGIGPQALIGYATVFERAISALLFGCKGLAQDGIGIAKAISENLDLPCDPADRLWSLLQRRNEAVHELSYRVQPSDVRKMWRLAKTALHHLLAKVSDTESWDDGVRKLEMSELEASGKRRGIEWVPPFLHNFFRNLLSSANGGETQAPVGPADALGQELPALEASGARRPIDWGRVLDEEFGKHDIAGNVGEILMEERPMFIQY